MPNRISISSLLLAAIIGGAMFVLAQRATEPNATPPTQDSILRAARLYFEPAAGALPAYRARGMDYTVEAHPAGVRLMRPAAQGVAQMNLTFHGAATGTTLHGAGASSGVAHYYLGADAARWRRDVPLHERVRYTRLYPGIDAEIYGTQTRFEYDFIVAPRADASQIALRFDAAQSVSIDAAGDLVVTSGHGTLRQPPPVAYQESNAGRSHVTASYSIENDNIVHIALGDYDASQPLIIDPVVDFSTYFGGSNGDSATRVATNADGDVYIVGYTFSSDMPQPHPQSTPPSIAGDVHAFVAMYRATGALHWVAYLGGAEEDHGRDITVDAGGNAYIVGETASGDFPRLGSTRSYGGARDAFVARFSSEGVLNYSALLGGGKDDWGHGISLGPQSRIYVAGETWSLDFPMDLSTRGYAHTCGGCDTTAAIYDGFLAVLNPDDSLYYSSYLGGSQNDLAHAVVAHPVTGVAYLTGETTSTDFPIDQFKWGEDQTLGSAGKADAYVVAIDPGRDGTDSLLYSSYIGGSEEDVGMDIALNNTSRVYIVGTTYSSDLTPRNAFQTELRGTADAFLAKYNTDSAGGFSVLFRSYFGGNDEDLGESVATIGESAVIAGMTHSIDLPITDAVQLTNAGEMDGFVTRFSEGGNEIRFASYFGGSNIDEINGVATKPDGTIVVVGDSLSTNFPVQAGSAANPQGVQDAVMFTVSGTRSIPASTGQPAKPASARGGGAFDAVWLIALLLLRRRIAR